MQNYSGKNLIADLYCRSGTASALDAILETRGRMLRILTYHRVRNWRTLKTDGLLPIDLGVDLVAFEAQMGTLRDEYNVISLETANKWLNGETELPRKAVVITFDDGYCDIFLFAFPILKKLGLTATVFIPSAYPSTSRIFWWDLLSLSLRVGNFPSASFAWLANECPAELVSLMKRAVSSRGVEQAGLSASIVDWFKKLEPELAHFIVTRLWQDMGIPASEAREYEVFSWEQAREMGLSGVMSFGSHTANHVILTNVDADMAQRELQESKQKIEKELGMPVTACAYPSGALNESVKQAARQAGYDLAVSTVHGVNRRGADRFALKRISMDNVVGSLFEMKVSAVYQNMRHLLRIG